MAKRSGKSLLKRAAAVRSAPPARAATPARGKKKAKAPKAKLVSMQNLRTQYTDKLKELRRQHADYLLDTMDKSSRIMHNSAADPEQIALAQQTYNEIQESLQRLKTEYGVE